MAVSKGRWKEKEEQTKGRKSGRKRRGNVSKRGRQLCQKKNDSPTHAWMRQEERGDKAGAARGGSGTARARATGGEGWRQQERSPLARQS